MSENELPPLKRFMLFGSVDGLTMFLGLVLGLMVSQQSTTAAWHAALGGAAGELIGMTTGQFMSDRADGIWVALACGTAGALACGIPAIPFFFTDNRIRATAGAVLIAMGVAAIVAWQRPEHGWQAASRTFGVLVGAGVLSGLTGLI
jgi:VIT1/CCC1 family predicted Fe2+/Mn2+ transporter